MSAGVSAGAIEVMACTDPACGGCETRMNDLSSPMTRVGLPVAEAHVHVADDQPAEPEDCQRCGHPLTEHRPLCEITTGSDWWPDGYCDCDGRYGDYATSASSDEGTS